MLDRVGVGEWSCCKGQELSGFIFTAPLEALKLHMGLCGNINWARQMELLLITRLNREVACLYGQEMHISGMCDSHKPSQFPKYRSLFVSRWKQTRSDPSNQSNDLRNSRRSLQVPKDTAHKDVCWFNDSTPL